MKRVFSIIILVLCAALTSYAQSDSLEYPQNSVRVVSDSISMQLNVAPRIVMVNKKAPMISIGARGFKAPSVNAGASLIVVTNNYLMMSAHGLNVGYEWHPGPNLHALQAGLWTQITAPKGLNLRCYALRYLTNDGSDAFYALRPELGVSWHTFHLNYSWTVPFTSFSEEIARHGISLRIDIALSNLLESKTRPVPARD